jgi:autotransporter-associated beta strand protein
MARNYSFWRLASATLGMLLITAWSAGVALGQYTFVQASAGSAAWHDNARWDPAGIPNAADATALLNMPITSAPAGNGFTLNINENDTTVGSLTIDNTNHDNSYVTRICGAANCTGKLIFQSTLGPATYTETAGTPNTTQNGRFVINPLVTLLSDLVFTQNNQPGLNTPTEITSLITAGSSITFTKEGVGNLQLTNNLSLFPGEGFLGQYIINEGGIRLIGRSAIGNSAGVTVNAGGQLQLADNAATVIPDWNLATGAVLNLNGNGKATGTTADGALRIGIQSGRTTAFNNEVVLQSDARINVAAANTTGVLSNVVSGPGGLTMMSSNLTGRLNLTNAGNSYTGDTRINSGTLSITNPFLANAADVYLTTGATLDLSFVGTDAIRSLYFDGVAQEIGTWGATGNLDADFQTDLITGTGLLGVTALPGLPGDYNNDNVVDAADYVLWRKNPAAHGGIPEGYNIWREHFGETVEGSGSQAPVPEPSAWLLAVFVICVLMAIPKRRLKVVRATVRV